MVAQLYLTGSEGTQTPLRFGEGAPIVIFEQVVVLLGYPVELAGLVRLLQHSHGDGMAVDEDMFVLRLKLLLVSKPGHAPPLRLH